MLKRFDRYVSRGGDEKKTDEELLDEIYMPELTRNGYRVMEVDLATAVEEEEEKAIYTCSICPDRKMRSLKEVNRHVESKAHKKRERMPVGGGEDNGVGETSKKKKKKSNKKRKKMKEKLKLKQPDAQE